MIGDMSGVVKNTNKQNMKELQKNILQLMQTL